MAIESYVSDMLDDFVGFFVYSTGGMILFALIVALAFALGYALWVMYHMLIIKANLILDEFEEKAETQFSEYIKKLGNNG